MARHILHVDLDAFFVAVEQARRPELRGKPVIVGGDPGGRGVVATASYEARAFGVHSAMPLRTAKRLAPDAIFLPGDYAEYVRISHAFHAILETCSPLVESGGLDEAYIDVTGCEPLVGTPENAAALIRHRVRSELGLAASVGISTSRLVSKVASDHAKPDGVCLVPEGEEAAFLAPMPLRALPMLGASTEKKLTQIGLSTLGQLAALPDATLESLLGRHGAVVGMRARGIDPTPVSAGDAEAKSVSREGTFASDVADPEHLRAVLRGFSESVAATLRRDGRRSRTITLKLRFEDFTTISRSVTLRRPANSNEAVYEAANRLLGKVREAERRPVRLIGVGASNLVDDAVQLTLEPSAEARGDSLSAAFDKVRGKYGRTSLQTGRTAFDEGVRDERGVFEKGTGLSSQMK
ncbi:MAG TPA: DNA polymerase IV [Dehalococcoidia bacterium]|nr:DNA polymerase IV [Dehalococcoidia bacterium]